MIASIVSETIQPILNDFVSDQSPGKKSLENIAFIFFWVKSKSVFNQSTFDVEDVDIYKIDPDGEETTFIFS